MAQGQPAQTRLQQPRRWTSFWNERIPRSLPRDRRSHGRHAGCIAPSHMRSASLSSQARQGSVAATLTDAEKPFRNAKLSSLALIAYKAVADVGGRSALFVITIVAARQLSPREFGLFGLGTTIGWMLCVATDFGVQMHLARAVAQSPAHAIAHLDHWWRFRLGAAMAGLFALALAL